MGKKAKRIKPVLVRMTEEEAEKAKAEAEKLGLPVSAYIRFLIHREENKGA